MRDLPHPFWSRNGETEKGHITAVRNDLPGIVAHTAAGGPKRAHVSVTSTGLDLRKRIPLTRFAAFCAAPPLKNRTAKQFGLDPADIAGTGKLLDLDLGAGLFELLLNRRGLVLVDAFLDGLWSTIHKVLGFFQAQPVAFSDPFTHFDLVAANVGEHHGESR